MNLMTKKISPIRSSSPETAEPLKQFSIFEISTSGEKTLKDITAELRLEGAVLGIWEAFPGLLSRTIALFSLVSNIWPYAGSQTLCKHAFGEAVAAYQKEKITLHRDDPYAVYLGIMLEEVSKGLTRFTCIGRSDRGGDQVFEPISVAGTLDKWAKISGVHTIFFEPMMRLNHEDAIWSLKMALAAKLLTPVEVYQIGKAGFPLVPNTSKRQENRI